MENTFGFQTEYNSIIFKRKETLMTRLFMNGADHVKAKQPHQKWLLLL